ncbi:iron transporter [Arcobacter sp. CECT 8986]|uniref:FeoA family protein n=1 Tax=Arcobacter sp. CECT 8986 TaxID=2044507 RepID=UPI001009A339|nr:FeoA family protein [Arcobacter sp. CECT 8986]RXJ99557.1 iron transporter [Arcobacter sp. CECT 8986]
MKLSELNKGDTGIILSLNCDSSLKNRFYSFGITKNTEVYIEEVTLTKNTIEVKINNTKVAIRLSEAAKIEVKK